MITEIKGHPKPYKGLGTKGQTYKPKMSLDLLCSHKSSGQESGGPVSFYVAYQSGGKEPHPRAGSLGLTNNLVTSQGASWVLSVV